MSADPRPIERVMLQFWVEILPAGTGCAVKYVGGAVHEFATPDGSWERVSPQCVADTIMARLKDRDLDSMWQIGRVAPAITCQPEQQTPEIEQQARQRHQAAKDAGTHQCCGEHLDGCQAPAYPCCNHCPDQGD